MSLTMNPVPKKLLILLSFFIISIFMMWGCSKEEKSDISYDLAEVRHYKDGGKPYVFWAQTNHTDKEITKVQLVMLAFDHDGKPLNIPWNVSDSSAGYSYEGLCEWEPVNFLPGKKADSRNGYEEGGWSLGWTIDMFEKDTSELRELFAEVKYILCCDKQVVFKDGSVWDNPEYDDWLEAYKGKEVEISVLENYYPSEQGVV